MPRYHFNVHDGTSIPDREGHELPNVEAAKRDAIDMCGVTIRELGNEFWRGGEWRMDVTDDRGLILFSLIFQAIPAPVLYPWPGRET